MKLVRLGAVALLAAAFVTDALPQVMSRESGRPRFDIRLDDRVTRDRIAADLARPEAASRRHAAEAMTRSAPGLAIDLHEILGTPAFLRSTDGYLTGEADPSAWLDLLKDYVASHPLLFGIEAGLLDACRVSRDVVTSPGGMRSITLQERVDGLDLLGAEIRASFTSRGEIVNVASTLIPPPASPVSFGGAPVTAEAALRTALAHVGIASASAPSARRAYLPMSPLEARPVWVVLAPERGTGNLYEVTLDAIDRRVLLSRDLTLHAAATYDVFARSASDPTPADSPTPMSPGSCLPTTLQPPAIGRTLQILTALSATASLNGWIDPNGDTTSGNNVAAHGPGDLPVTGSSFRIFDFPLDLTAAPGAYRSAAVTQLFYTVNWIHDRLYQLGFDEAAGNFQTDDFGRGGLGGDAIDAIAQDTGSNNAFFVPAPDGTPGSLHMFVFTGPTPDRDGDLDAEVAIHETVHGLSTRLVGDLSGAQAEGMGEGWSDFVSLALLSEAADDPRGCYAEAAYVAYQLFGLTQNYTFGIRRFPYSDDRTVNPETFADIDPGQMAFDPSIPRSPLIGSVIDTNAAEAHNVGEVWAEALWSARARLLERLGFAGNERMLQLVVDGMKLAPPNPTFVQARDAILEADRVDFAGVDLAPLWIGFAERGLGISAVAPPPSTTTGVVEAFDIPPGIPATIVGTIPALSARGLTFLAAVMAAGAVVVIGRRRRSPAARR
jgi:hypothetical protein